MFQNTHVATIYCWFTDSEDLLIISLPHHQNTTKISILVCLLTCKSLLNKHTTQTLPPCQVTICINNKYASCTNQNQYMTSHITGIQRKVWKEQE